MAGILAAAVVCGNVTAPAVMAQAAGSSLEKSAEKIVKKVVKKGLFMGNSG